MKNDKKIHDLVEAIANKCRNWVGIVDSANQDAYTDRLLETIIDDSKELARLHEERFKKI